jgi:uncharacterized membrane protein
MEPQTLAAIGFILIFIGVVLLILTLLMLSVYGIKKGKLKGGGVILIGPVPLIFGTDEESVKTL